jgi:hypothetical protein
MTRCAALLFVLVALLELIGLLAHGAFFTSDGGQVFPLAQRGNELIGREARVWLCGCPRRTD